MTNCYYLILFGYFTHGTSDTFWHPPQRKKMALLTFALVAMLATTLAMTFVVSEGEGDAISHTDEPWQITAALNLEPYLPAGDTWPILDLTASALLPEYAFAQTVNAFILTAAGSITDTTNLELDGARGIAIYESGGSRYAAVTGFSDDGVQILDITDPDDITAAGSITDTTSLELDGARDIAIYESGGSRYAVVTASADNGVQILDITDPANIIAADSVTYNDGLKIVSAWSVAVFESGGSRYAAVTGFYDDGVQILDITNPADITAAGSITDTTSLELDGARGIAIYESGGSRYAAVTGYYDDGVQILDITDPDDITAAGSITDTTSLELDGARDIAIYESGGSRYAAVTANDDNGVQILDITDPDDITAAGSITDTTSLKLDTARGIAIYESGTSRYAAITASVDDGVQILDITNPADITAAGSITETTNLELDGAEAITVFESGTSRYAAVAAFNDDGVQIIRIDSVMSANPRLESIERFNPSSATTNSQSLIYRATFSESVTGVNTSDFVLSTGGGNAGTNSAISISGSGSVYYVTISAAQDGTYNLDLVSSGHNIADYSSNPLTNTATTGADETYTVSTAVTDTANPRLESIERFNPSSATTNSQSLVYRATFSESVTGVTASDFTLSPASTGGGGTTTTSPGQFTQTRSSNLAIPDDDTVSDTITVPNSGTATSVSVAIDITHTWIGDLKITLIAPDGTTQTLHDRSGGSADDINQTYTPSFGSIPISGVWTLQINDNYDADPGTLNNWTLTINYGTGSQTVSPVTGVSGSGDTYYVTVSSTADGTYNLDLVSSGHNIADYSSNPLTNTATTGTDETYTVSTAVTDTANPRLESIERYSPASQNTDSQSLIYRATFSESVTGVNTSDFVLSTGGGNAGTNSAISISGSGSVYYVTISAAQDGTYNLDLVSSGHNIADYSSNPLTNTATTGADETYTVSTAVTDTANPRLESIERFNPSSATTNSQSLVYRATFSESVTGVTASDFTLSPASTGGGGTTTTSPGQFTQTRSSNLAIPDDDTVSDTITVPNSGTATSVSVAIDITHTWIGDLKITLIAPDGTTQTLHDRSGGSADDINQTYTPSFGSIPISGVWTLQINDNYDADPGTLNNWTLTINYGTGSQTVSPVTGVSGSGDTYYVTVSSTADGTYNLDLVSSGHNIADYSSNPLTNTATTGTDETYTVSTAVTDTANPRLESIERYSPASQNTDSQSLIYRATFSESVTGVTASDFTLSPASTVVPPPPVTTSPGQFTQTRSSNLAIPDDDTVSDTITVPNSGTATSVSVAIDITHTWIGDLKITLIAPDGTTQTLHDRSGGSADDINQTYTPSFGSIPISGVWTLQINDNYDADPGTLNNWTLTINYGTGSQTVSPVTGVSGSGDTYYVTVSSTADGTYNLDLVSSGHNIADYSSNPLTNTATTGTDETYTVSTAVTDTANPRLESIERYSPASQNTDSQSLIYRATFSESVTGVTASDFTLSPASTGSGNNGTSPVTGVSGSGNTYYVTVSAAQDGTYNLDLVSSGHGIKDAADNSLTNATPTTGADEMYTVSITVTDTAAPTILSIERNNPSSAVTSARVLTYKVTFSDDVTGVDKADFVLSPDSTGSTSSYIPVVYVGGSGSMYTVVVITLNDGTYNLDLVSSGHGIADTDDNLLTNIVPVTGTDETYTYTAAN